MVSSATRSGLRVWKNLWSMGNWVLGPFQSFGLKEQWESRGIWKKLYKALHRNLYWSSKISLPTEIANLPRNLKRVKNGKSFVFKMLTFLHQKYFFSRWNEAVGHEATLDGGRPWVKSSLTNISRRSADNCVKPSLFKTSCGKSNNSSPSRSSQQIINDAKIIFRPYFIAASRFVQVQFHFTVNFLHHIK